ncbi:hypothetical protein H634G_03717 [Metarhizium anisopliae BRIP 53293]|uniref:Intradiol ring-cleavage dioxygenases domain-containing protein n=1 Tax=Metarhizium anisopliae BRIP 53293 TaxID=1291518 RepID=A0A0D9P4Y2_METAN|nr:hypothetical protein H634G_03717 [Metarhizium anisopliae BRIP 53293]KJK91884.1 hypothetical protein H633G_04209 [Metarhizium anisopliae BRIP 53284]
MSSNQQNGAVLGREFTQNVIDAMGPKTSPRLRQVMGALISHIHDFAREVQLTTDDLVDDITYTTAIHSANGLTASAILGPFWRHDTPHRDNGTTITFDTPPDGQVVYMHGKVTDVTTGKPLQNASVDVWQASTNGLYEQQDDDQKEHNLRGVFHTDAEGCYSFYCLRPTPYPVPMDGPAGKLLAMMDRQVFRPAHIHLMVQQEGYKSLTTQIFDQECKYLDKDSVFAVKDELKVEFVPRKGDPQAPLELEYNITLAKTS